MSRSRMLLLPLGILGLFAYGALVAGQLYESRALSEFQRLEKLYPPDSQKPAPARITERKLRALNLASRLAPGDPDPAFQSAVLRLVIAESQSLSPQHGSVVVGSGPDP